MGAALAEGGKTLPESDAEVSEAVDFAEFYGRCAEYFANHGNLSSRGRGVVVVVSPWNFPIAIPCGGVAAALAAGNTVILKPASDTVLIAQRMCDCFWRAGLSRRTLQLLPCSGSTVGQQLVSHADVDTVVLTGGTETALAMLVSKPDMHLLAETGGKNATIVTALADRDQAIKTMLRALNEYRISGVQTTIPFCRYVLEHADFRSGNFSTQFVEDRFSPEALGRASERESMTAALAAVLTRTRFSDGFTPARDGTPADGWSLWAANRRRGGMAD